MNIRDINEAERQEIAKYLMLDEQWLYSLIPPYLPEYERAFFESEGQIKAGRKKFEEMRQNLHEVICEDFDICRKIDDPVLNDTLNLVVVIGDVISATIVGIPPFLLASIVVKIGVRNFCNCEGMKEGS